MRNRLIMGCFRYETWEEKRKKGDSGDGYDYVPDMIRRLQLYQETGNDELLIDVANMAMLEFEFGRHPLKHFESVDDGEHVPLKSEANFNL